MITPAIPVNEAQRLEVLRSLKLLDTAPEERFDRLTRLAKRLFGIPTVLVSLVDADRQWFKSSQGLPVSETPRSVSFCGHAILSDEILMVPDTLADRRFADNPLVEGEPHIRFYAGCPLTAGGFRIGTLCLLGPEPRVLDEDERRLLRDLARMAEQEIASAQLATMDELTLLSNRRGFMALGRHALSLCARVERNATMFYFDLDNFKAVNDRYGHAEGDRTLLAFAGLLRATFRDTDVIGRIGGDEFVVLMSNCTQAEANHALERLQESTEEHNRNLRGAQELNFSSGVVPYQPLRHGSIDALVSDADEKMYAAKRVKRAA